MRSQEYHDRDAQYNWISNASAVDTVFLPIIYDYSRLNFVFTVLSKRHLQTFVDQKQVTGWNDPRMPTIQGLLRRGLTVEGLKKFLMEQGACKRTSYQHWDKIWALNKKFIDPWCHRYNAVSCASDMPVHVRIYGSDFIPGKTKDVALVPRIPDGECKQVVYSDKIFIEDDDIKLLKIGDEITLLNWCNAIVKHVIDQDHKSMVFELNPKGSVKSTKYKIHWVSDMDMVKIETVKFNHLIKVPKFDKKMKLNDVVNDVTMITSQYFGEKALSNIVKGQIIQLQRHGYFICDSVSPLILFQIPDGKM